MAKNETMQKNLALIPQNYSEPLGAQFVNASAAAATQAISVSQAKQIAGSKKAKDLLKIRRVITKTRTISAGTLKTQAVLAAEMVNSLRLDMLNHKYKTDISGLNFTHLLYEAICADQDAANITTVIEANVTATGATSADDVLVCYVPIDYYNEALENSIGVQGLSLSEALEVNHLKIYSAANETFTASTLYSAQPDAITNIVTTIEVIPDYIQNANATLENVNDRSIPYREHFKINPKLDAASTGKQKIELTELLSRNDVRMEYILFYTGVASTAFILGCANSPIRIYGGRKAKEVNGVKYSAESDKLVVKFDPIEVYHKMLKAGLSAIADLGYVFIDLREKTSFGQPLYPLDGVSLDTCFIEYTNAGSYAPELLIKGSFMPDNNEA